jgi:Glucose-6-phosphate dehydrogenase, C-terminal domain
MAENFGIWGGRFYDDTGAIRDVAESHMLQVAAFLAMEAPLARMAMPSAMSRSRYSARFRRWTSSIWFEGSSRLQEPERGCTGFQWGNLFRRAPGNSVTALVRRAVPDSRGKLPPGYDHRSACQT